MITTVEETNRSLIENLSNLEKELENYKELSHSDQKKDLNKINATNKNNYLKSESKSKVNFLFNYFFFLNLFSPIFKFVCGIDSDYESEKEKDYYILKVNSKSQEKGCPVIHCQGRRKYCSRT